MSPLLDGVRIGPLDPDRGENFGQVGGQSTARQLIRHHAAMNPPALSRALNRVRQDERTGAIDKAEAEDFIRGVYADAGEAIPDDSKITGLAVRGDEEDPDAQVVAFTFTTKGGRSAKGFVPYRKLSGSVEAGDEALRIKALKDAGLPWQPSEAARAAAGITGSGIDGEPQDTAALDEARAEAERARAEAEQAQAEKNELQQQLDALQARLTNLEEGRQPDADEESDEDGEAGDGEAGNSGELREPYAGYDDAKAQDVVARLRSENSAELASAVLAYEQRADAGQQRSTVISAANQILDHSSS